MRRFIGVNLPLGCKINAGHPPGNRQPFAVQRFYSQRSAIKCNNRAAHIQRDLLWGKIQHPAAAIGNNAPGADLQIRQTVKIGVRLAQQVVPTRSPVMLPVVWGMSIMGRMAARTGSSFRSMPKASSSTAEMMMPPPLTPAAPMDIQAAVARGLRAAARQTGERT